MNSTKLTNQRIVFRCNSTSCREGAKDWGECNMACKRRNETYTMRSDANYHPTNPQAEIKLYCPCYRKVAQEFIDLEASEDITLLNCRAIVQGMKWLDLSYPTLTNVQLFNECKEAVNFLNAGVPLPL